MGFLLAYEMSPTLWDSSPLHTHLGFGCLLLHHLQHLLHVVQCVLLAAVLGGPEVPFVEVLQALLLLRDAVIAAREDDDSCWVWVCLQQAGQACCNALAGLSIVPSIDEAQVWELWPQQVQPGGTIETAGVGVTQADDRAPLVCLLLA